jgi:hypothetical protein
MLGIAHNPSTPIGSKGSLCLGAVVLALFGVMVFSGSARADRPASVGETPTATETPVGALPEAPEAPETPPVVPVVPSPEVVPPAPAPEVVLESTPAVPTPEAVPAVPAPEPAPAAPTPEVGLESTPAPPPEAVPATPPPEAVPATPPPEAVPATPPPEAVPAVPHPEGALEALPVGAGRELALEAPAAGAGKEGSAEGSASPAAGAPEDVGGPGRDEVEVAPKVPNDLVGLPVATSAPTNGSGETTAARAGGGVAGTVVSRPAGDLTCEFSALQGRVGPNCRAGLIGATRLLATSPSGFAGIAAASMAADMDPPGEGGHGGSAVLRLPASPAPGPAPSGVSGGSSTGTSGLALSGFLTLSGQLRLAAPRALRRLRLSSAPWRTACFVLIPERPG